MKINIKVITLFPEMFPGPLGFSIIGSAIKNGNISIETVNPRDFAYDGHKTVDDTPCGGGPGMIMRADVLGRAIESISDRGVMIYSTPRGRPLCQKDFEKWKSAGTITILCGRYEGVDQRVIDFFEFDEVSIGDFVLCGGEIPAMTIIEGCARLIAIGNADSLCEESFANGLLEHPQYTLPREWNGLSVPEVLISGNHGKIREWKLEQACEATKKVRPDLWTKHENNVTNLE